MSRFSLLPLLLVLVLVVVAVTHVSAESFLTHSSVCKHVPGTFDRYTLSGQTNCVCEPEKPKARCAPINLYPTPAPGSPAHFLALYHKPKGSAESNREILTHQINFECNYHRRHGRQCLLTEGVTESGLAVCDCI